MCQNNEYPHLKRIKAQKGTMQKAIIGYDWRSKHRCGSNPPFYPTHIFYTIVNILLVIYGKTGEYYDNRRGLC